MFFAGTPAAAQLSGTPLPAAAMTLLPTRAHGSTAASPPIQTLLPAGYQCGTWRPVLAGLAKCPEFSSIQGVSAGTGLDIGSQKHTVSDCYAASSREIRNRC